MLKRIILSIFVAISSFNVSASIDSINVEELNGYKNIVHKVEAKESYYSIARKYAVSPQTVIQFNNNRSLQIGTIIRVPTERPFNEPATNNLRTNAVSKVATIEYKVGAREYLGLIARKFNTTVEDLKTLNNLSGNNLAIGQMIKVPYGTAPQEQLAPSAPAPLDTQKVIAAVPITQIDTNRNASDRLKLPPSRYGLREVTERGFAYWITDENLDGTKMLALHQTAPIGTVVKITNPITGTSTFAKVVGKFIENESNKEAIIITTKAAADLIGASDKRFQVLIVYGVPNE